MCGIAGFLGGAANEAIARKMANAIASRGPDDSGVWIDSQCGVALAHRRLSIVDLSPAGHQPMQSANGRFVIVFNGEIYNHLDLRADLKRNWRGGSDTETLIEAIAEWGAEAAVKRCVGMFAFALWDSAEKTLTLARDRLGEKPLYYGESGGVFLFGSELKALRAYDGFAAEIDRDALALYLRHGYIPAPFSIYKTVRKLRPARLLTIAADGAKREIEYWSAREAFSRPLLQMGEVEAADELERLLSASVRSQMVADVPLGAFLSGGVDSSSVVALMQAQSSRPVRTFSIGFNEESHNEAPHAKAVAAHLGTDHTELYVEPKDALAVIPKLPAIYDEPFGDSSQIPTFLVSEMTRRSVTVSLSGDGGDELFCGYDRYFLAERIWRKIGHISPFVRRLIAGAIAPFGGFGRLGDRLNKLSEVLSFDRPERLYQNLISSWKNPAAIVLGASEPPTIVTDPSQWLAGRDTADSMQFTHLNSYLEGDILAKVDRAAMSVSLETRVPMLDFRVVEFAARLPRNLKIDSRGVGKKILRELLYRHVPREIIDRPKMGFGVPIERWLRGELKDWADDLLSVDRLKREGFFDPTQIARKWSEHRSGKRAWHYYLWHILTYESWLDAQK